MWRIALFSLAVTLGAAGCQAWTGASVPTPSQPHGTAAEKRTAAIYAAVIRELVMKDHTYGEGPSPFKRVFVVRTAGDPYVGRESPPRPVSTAVRRGVLADLRDLPPVRFVDPGTVLAEQRSCRGLGVRRGGVLVSVGPIARAQGQAVTVAAFLVAGCLGKNGQWLTYVLEPKHGGWRVVGTKGPIAIA